MNKDGLLDFSEFRYALQALGFSHLARPELISQFRAHARPRPNWTPLPAVGGHAHQPPQQQQQQPPQPGVVDLRLAAAGFQTIAAGLVARRDPREELLRTFALFDHGDKGMITLDDLRRVVKDLGDDVPDPELASMIEQFDVEGKGGVYPDEFLGIFMPG